MVDIWHEVEIEVQPDAVYKALTEQNDLSSWWTQRVKAEPKTGTTSEFTFMGGQYVIKTRITKLTPGKEVNWDMVQGAPDWANTHVYWELSPTEKGTKVLLSHRDFASAGGSLPNTSYNWAYYLTSLKSYLETGSGTPHPM